MSKLTVKTKDFQDVMQPLKASVTPLEEKLMELFSASEKSFLAEEAMEERISALVQDFLYAKTASTDIDLELIIQEFSENKIPALPTDVGDYIDCPFHSHLFPPIYRSHDERTSLFCAPDREAVNRDESKFSQDGNGQSFKPLRAPDFGNDAPINLRFF